MAIIYKQPYAKYVPKYEKPVAKTRASKKQRAENRARVRALGAEIFGASEE